MFMVFGKYGNKTASPLRALVQGTIVLAISNVVLKALNFFLLPLYTSYLTPAELGMNDTITNFTSLIYTILVLSFDGAYSAFYYDNPTEEHKSKVLSTTWITLFCASLVAIALIFFANPISSALFGSTKYAVGVSIALASVTLNLWWLPLSLDLRMRSKMGLYSITIVAASALMIALNIVFVTVLQLGFYALICGLACANFFQFVFFVLLGKSRPRLKGFDPALLRDMLRYALPMMPTALAYWILQLSSTYILLAFSSSTEVGVYGIATRCANAANMIASAFFTSYTAYAFQQANEDPEAPKKFSTIMNIFVFLFATACTAGSLFGPEIIHLMTTPDYAAASFMLPGVLFGQLFYNVYRIAGYGVSFSKQSKYLAFPIFAAAGCALAGYLLLIPRLGGIGASVSLCIAYAVMAIMVFRFAQRLYPCPYETKKLLVGCSFCLASSFALVSLSLPIRAVGCLVCIGALVALFKTSLVQAKATLAGIGK